MTPHAAYYFAKNNPDCDIEKYQKIACENSWWAYYFAQHIPDANIKYCQEHACIKYCQEHACKSSEYAYYFEGALYFATDIPEADIEYCYGFETLHGRKYIEKFILKDL